MTLKRVFLLLIWGLFPLLHGSLPAGHCLLALAGGRACAQASGDNFWSKLKNLLNKNNANNNTRESVTEKYELYFDYIHSEEKKLYDSLSGLGNANWDKYQNIIRVDYKRTQDTTLQNKLASTIKVFGWHPYWMGSAYQSYRFDLLSYIAWFSYNVDPYTGKYDNPDVIAAWKNAQELMSMAKAHDCRVLLTITNHTETGNRLFLKNPESQRVLADSLIALLAAQGAHGVDVNFELVPDGLEAEMTAFLQNLSRRLKAANPDYLLTVDLPIQDYLRTYQLDRLDPYVDLFIVTGYDYHNVRSKTDGPVAPLDVSTGRQSIKHSVNRYLQAGLKREKILLGLPWYGAVWTALSPAPGKADSTLRFSKHLTYKDLQAKYCREKPQYDLERWSGFFISQDKDSGLYEKCWFDDSLTLGRKMDWILQEKLAGMGIWALGYDNGHRELWNLIETKYASDTALVYREPYIESRYFHLTRSLMEYRSLVAVAGIFIVVFLLAGLVVSLFDWRVREVFFQHRTLRLLYALGGIGILLSVFAFYLYVRGKPLLDSNGLLALGLGLTLGVCLTLLISYRYERNLKKLP